MGKFEGNVFRIQISCRTKFCDTKFIGMNRSLKSFHVTDLLDMDRVKKICPESRARNSARLTGLKFIIYSASFIEFLIPECVRTVFYLESRRNPYGTISFTPIVENSGLPVVMHLCGNQTRNNDTNETVMQRCRNWRQVQG